MCKKNIETLKVVITENTLIAEDIYRMSFNNSLIAKKTKPGQFLNIKIPHDNTLILRRPFSVYDINDTKVSVIYMSVGKGTRVMSKMPAGTEIDILGPLGKGFDPVKNMKANLIGGGCGTPPLFFLGKILKNMGIEIHTTLGFSSKYRLILLEEFQSISKTVRFATDDGSAGFKGNVIDILNIEGYEKGAFYACGPMPLLSSLKDFCGKINAPLQVSLEEKMGCGFGVCLACAVKTHNDDFKYVCKDGPVFDANDIIFPQNFSSCV
jgi:dihydroorotate dehydrogenase electron transfer subunit